MKPLRFLIHSAFLISLSLPFVSLAQKEEDIVIGKTHFIKSKVLKEERKYLVYTPTDYDLSMWKTQRYPVMILLDGGVYFHPATGVVRFLSGVHKIPPMIVVAIPNTDRSRDLSISPSTKGPNGEDYSELFTTTGGADQFMEFIAKELLPQVDKDYRTIPYRMLVGHSLGGLFAADAFIGGRPEFLSYIAIDPALWWDDNKIIRDLKEDRPDAMAYARYFYMSSAHNSPNPVDTSAFRKSQEAFYELVQKKRSNGVRYAFEKFESDNHSSVFLESLDRGLRFIFKDFEIRGKTPVSVDAMRLHFEEFSEQLGTSFKPPQELLHRAGDHFVNNMHSPEQALPYYLCSAEYYPQSDFALKKCAETMINLGKEEDAIGYFERYLKLNPGDKSIKARVKELKKNK